MARGTRVGIGSSGAAAAGRETLGFSDRPEDLATLQACASAGQARLTQAYADVLAERGIPCGQVLLTRRDVMDRDGFLNARTTLSRLIELGAVPVVNENDTVSTAEFAFGDNDMLGALVSAMVGADLYLICSDVDGLYTANPQEDPTATLIEHVDEVGPELTALAGGRRHVVWHRRHVIEAQGRPGHARRRRPHDHLSREEARRAARRRGGGARRHALRGPGRRAA